MPPLTATRAIPVLPCKLPLAVERSLLPTCFIRLDRKNNQLTHNPRGMAPVAHVLFNKFMRFNPQNPSWLNRDRFVLS